MDDTSAPKPHPMLDDLEAIRDLLDQHRSPHPMVDPDLIPVLCEVVDPAPLPSADRDKLAPQLRTEASLIMRQVIEEFMPQIEAELRRRLEVRLDHLMRTRTP